MADTLILLVLALVVFGPRKLPTIGRQIGKLMYELRKASNDFRFQLEEELNGGADAAKSWKEETQQPKDAPSFEQLTAEAIAAGERAGIAANAREAAERAAAGEAPADAVPEADAAAPPAVEADPNAVDPNAVAAEQPAPAQTESAAVVSTPAAVEERHNG